MVHPLPPARSGRRVARQPGGGSTELAVQAVNSLGATLYQTLVAAQPTANLVLSPAGIAIALAMAREGAAGITATEMDQVLGVNDLSVLAPSMNALDQALAARTGTFPDASGTRPIDVTLRIVSRAVGPGGPGVVGRLPGPPGHRLRGRPAGHRLRR